MSGNIASGTKLRSWLAQMDWPLLLFLAGATYVKLYLKIAAVAGYAAWLLFRKVRLQKPPGPVFFYLAMPVLGIAAAAAHGSFSSTGFVFGAMLGFTQWLTGASIVYLLFLTAKTGSPDRMAVTISGFFALNILATLVQFGGLIIESGHLMPYWFYDSGLKYGASTGDRLPGIFMNNSLNNAAVMLLGVLYFITRGQRAWTAACVLVLLMCTSNVATFGMIALLLLLFVFGSGRRLRGSVALTILFTTFLYPAISPQNFKYVETVTARLFAPSKPFIAAENPVQDTILAQPDTAQTVAYTPKRSLSLQVPEAIYRNMPAELASLREYSRHMPKPAWSYLALEPDAIRLYFRRWYGVAPDSTLLAAYGKPAKLFAIRQTIGFLNTSAAYWMAGAGMGNFSSKLAVKMTGLGLQGSFPDKRIYISRPFLEYHFYTLMYVFSRDVKEHSVINMPGGSYVQLAGEYGLAGLLLFAGLYLGWFWLRCRTYKGGRWMMLALLGLFWLDYWFEVMTITVVLELLLLQGIFAASSHASSSARDHGINARL